MNNSFVAKTTIKAISPGEGFTCSLGVDTSVKVECKPAQKFHEEVNRWLYRSINEQVGLLAKWSMVVHEQHILVKNTKSSENVTVTLKEPIPRSSDEKIRVS